jgi:hypothetical protein
MDLLLVEKTIPTISMNCGNQAMIMKVNSSTDNITSSRHVKRWLKSIKKLRNFGMIELDYVHMSKWQINPQRDYRVM